MKSLLIIITAITFVFSKSADDYFHSAAYKYIDGRQQEASVEAEEGLREYPNDLRLKRLNGLLNQMKDQQRQDQNQSGGSGQQNKDNKQNQNGKNDQKNDQNKNQQNSGKDQQNKQQPPKDTSGQGKENKPQQPPQQPKPENGNAADSSGKKGDSAAQAGQVPRQPGQMSKEEAERLLNSFVDDEKQAQQQRQGTPHKRPDNGQDW